MTFKGTVSAIALAMCLTMPAWAESPTPADTEKAASPFDGFSVTVDAVSDYRDRGLSLSDDSPALQISLDWEHDSGFYLGAWGSNVDFNDGGEAKYELDVYGGYTFSWANFDWDFMVNGIFYPGASQTLDYDLVEFSLAAERTIGIVKAKPSITFSPDNFGDSGVAFYPQLELEAPIGETGFSATGSYGFQSIENKARYGFGDYSDWSAGIKYAWNDIEFALQYIDTNLSKSQCSDGCDATAVFSISHTFGGGE
ncbi:MAG: TorF family putative porin [bacterium]|nr:TorF family putative porin [bacterium]